MKRSNNLRQVLQAIPELEGNVDVENAANALDELQALAKVAESEGGKILIANKIDKAGSIVTELIAANRNGDFTKVPSLIARLEAYIGLISDLKRAEESADNQQEILDSIIESTT